MPTLNIAGKKVKVGDEFMSLTPEEQNATVDEIANSFGAAPQQQNSTSMDVLSSGASGIARGAADLAGLPGTLGDLFNNGMSKLTGLPQLPQSPVSGNTLRGVESYATGGATDYQPQTTPGKFAGAIGQFLPGAVAMGGAGSLARNVVQQGVVPAVASEGAGQVADKYAPSVAPYARVAGAVLGSVAPSLGRAMLPSAEDAALSEVAKAARADGYTTPQQMQQRLDELGPQSIVADIGPNTQGQTGALANLPGPNNETIRGALNTRQDAANGRLGQALDQLGPRIIPSEVQAGIADSQAAVGRQYGPVMQSATRVDTQPLAARLEAAITNTRGPEQRAINNVRQYLNIPGTDVLDPNPQALLATRQAIDGLLTDETNPQVIRQLTMARQEVDATLAQAAPGIKDVDAQYSELARQSGALDEGQRSLDSGRTAPRPEELQQRLTEGAIPQGNQIGPSAVPLRMSQGTRADLDRIVGNNSNDVAAMNRLIKGEGDWNRQKLVSTFGERKTQLLLDVLSQEQQYAATRNFALGNSVSANRLQYMKAYDGGRNGMSLREYYGAGGMLGALRGAGVKTAEKLASSIIESRGTARNAEIAKNLTARDAVVSALLQRQTQGSRLTGPAKLALVQALLAQRQQLAGQ